MTESRKMTIRSSASKDTDPETGVMLGRALAMEYKRVVVGRDYMKSSTMMMNALVAGLTSAGADVIELGRVAMPVLGMQAAKGDCAVYITEYLEYGRMSGYILLNSDGGLFRIEQIRHLDRILSEDINKAPSRVGAVLKYHLSIKEYNERLYSVMNGTAECAIVLDCNCGSSSLSAPQILNKLGADLVSMNAQFDRDYTAHSLIPADSDLRDLRQFIGSDPGTMGIALNRIGNLMTVLDEKGNIIPSEIVLALIVMFTKPSCIVIPMTTSSLVEDAFYGRIDIGMVTDAEPPKREDLRLIRTVPSAGAVCDEVTDSHADLGYYGGGFVFSDISMAPDAIHAACIIAMVAADNSLNKLVAAFPEYHTDEKQFRISCSREEFRHMMDGRIDDLGREHMSNRYGWRVDMESGWFIIELDRYENDKVTVTAESRDRAYLVGMAELAADLVEACSKGQ